MLGTRITSFALGFACASGLSMYKLKEEIWSSHKILADQVRELLLLGVVAAPSPVFHARCISASTCREWSSESPSSYSYHLSFFATHMTVCRSCLAVPLCLSLALLSPSRLLPPPPSPPMARAAAVRGDGGSSFKAGDDRVQAVKGDAHGRERWVHGQQSKAFVEKKAEYRKYEYFTGLVTSSAPELESKEVLNLNS